ncbi:MAG: hypothetical protein CMP59_06590 [Flavobacteriales bacterium]|nr:hypothetical protein [Flavobacteriales bacterium]
MLLAPTLLFSQALDSPPPIEKVDYKAYVGFSLGFSIPNGSFASTDEENNQSAYAVNGQSFQLLDVGYRVYQNLNASAHYMRLQNSIDENALARNLRTPGLRYTVDASNYELNAAFVGIGFIKPSNSISLQMQIMIGYGNIFIPTIDLVETDDMGNSSTIHLASTSESSIGFGVSGGFRIHLTDRLDFSSQAAFINFQKEFDQVARSGNQVSVASGKINYEVISVTFGFSYRFLPQ